MGTRYDFCRIGQLRRMHTLAQMAKILDITLGAADGRKIKTDGRKADLRSKRENPLDDTLMHGAVTNNAFFADLFPAGFKLRLDQTHNISVLFQQALESART